MSVRDSLRQLISGEFSVPIGDGGNLSPSGEASFGEMAADSAAMSQLVLHRVSFSRLQGDNCAVDLETGGTTMKLAA